MITLAVEKRAKGAAPLLRRSGSIPAVVYGAHYASTPIAVSALAFEKIFREVGEATVISLSGLGATVPVLIYDVDLDPLTNRPRHIDFYAVTKGEKVEVAVPLVFIGESPAARDGANIVKVLHEIEVEADPMNLPREIEVDISSLLAIDDQIRAKDLVLPSGVVLTTEPEEVVVLVQAVVAEVVEAEPTDISQVEVEKKGKEEGEEEGESSPN